MANLPEPTNPVVLYFSGETPSMKNDITIRKKGKKYAIGRSAEVKKYLANAGDIISEQWRRQGFDQIPVPYGVAGYVSIGVHVKNIATLPTQDLDNMYTAFQETWAGSVIENDRQVCDYKTHRFPVFSKKEEVSFAFLWAIAPEYLANADYMMDCLIKFYTVFFKTKTKKDLLDIVHGV